MKNEFNPDYLCNLPECNEVRANIVEEYQGIIEDLNDTIEVAVKALVKAQSHLDGGFGFCLECERGFLINHAYDELDEAIEKIKEKK